MAMKEAIYDAAWGLGIRGRNLIKRLGLLGPVEPFALRLIPRLIPPPSTDVAISLPYGIRMIVPARFPSARSFASGLYEQDVTRLFKDLVRQGMVVVDVGANVGYYSLLASRLVGASGRVYAFEPDPVAFTYLAKNLDLNGCKNVVAVAQAISDATATMKFVRDPHGAEGFLMRRALTEGTLPVQAITLDRFFASQGWPTVHLVKMDIEGGEEAALIGMRELRRRNSSMRLIMEFNLGSLRRAGASPSSLAASLLDTGFSRGRVIEQGMKTFSVSDAFPRSRATHNLLLEADSDW